MISGIFVKIISVVLLISVGVEKYKIFLFKDFNMKIIEITEMRNIKNKNRILFFTFFVSI